MTEKPRIKISEYKVSEEEKGTSIYVNTSKWVMEINFSLENGLEHFHFGPNPGDNK